jgi:aspartokinase/homoserine dehydrogenase 1
MSDKNWLVSKFGGSSLADASCYRRVAEILETGQLQRHAVVVSASKGITDMLVRCLDLAEHAGGAVVEVLESAVSRYRTIADDVLDELGKVEFFEILDRDTQDLKDILRAISIMRSAANISRDVVSGYGELWSAQLLSRFLARRWGEGRVRWLDARETVVIEQHELGPVVRWQDSKARLAQELPDDFDGLVVVTGFIASDARGLQANLGRNGSDYSGSIFGALLDAREIVIWTDVDGVMSADPRRVPDASVIESLSYSEAMELSYFGAKVIHPQTMHPAVDKKIPIVIKNSFNPGAPGTVISAAPGSPGVVKGITAIDGIALINVEGAGMIGVPGTADRLFGGLKDAGVSVVLISQASSEHSICVAVPERDAGRAATVIREAFAAELRGGQIHDVEVTAGNSILAVVGDGMAGAAGVSGKVFGALGKAGINVRAIAQGSSERNISCVIDSEHASRALRAVHASFYLSPQTVSIGLIGPGHVGSVLLDQFAGELERLRKNLNLDLRVRGIAGSKRMLLESRACYLPNWRTAYAERGDTLDMDRFVDHVQSDHLPHAVIIDCSASGEVASHYAAWLERGIHVITPNKRAGTAPMESYRALRKARRAGNTRFLYETTVGAGLPIIRTLQDLIQTGDKVESIEGILSGTLAYLFNLFDGSVPFSSLVKKAREQGFTEPDPRDDLSGMDVARKLVILGREMGLDLELSDIGVESLVPDGLDEADVDTFLDRLTVFDESIARRLEQARGEGKVLRYIARLDASGKATVGLEAIGSEHAFSRIDLTDNIVKFSSLRYAENPLIVRGPGAGADVTAAGIFADLLRLTGYLGAAL